MRSNAGDARDGRERARRIALKDRCSESWRHHRSGIAVISIPVGDRVTLNLERKLIPRRPSTRFPNGLPRWTATVTPSASALPTLIELAYPISANAAPPTALSPHSPDERAEFRRGLRDSDIAISSLSWIDRGGHGSPKG